MEMVDAIDRTICSIDYQNVLWACGIRT